MVRRDAANEGSALVVKKKKSVLASGLLSFFFGPIGWFYAAPYKVAAVGAGVWILCCGILPSFILAYLIALVAPLSAIGGVLYAIGFNVTGERMPLFGAESAKKQLPK